MIVRSIRHRGLRRLFENDSSRLMKQDLVERVRGIVAAPAMAENGGQRMLPCRNSSCCTI